MSRDHIKVAVRVRPLLPLEVDLGCNYAVSISGKTVLVQSDLQQPSFEFDYCYWSCDPTDPRNASQEVVYADLGVNILRSTLDGYNGCLIAYGQTGSGKSYTTMGYGMRDSGLGIIPRTVEALYQEKARMEASQVGELRIWAAYMEIYNEHVHDLLQPHGQGSEPLRLHDHPEIGATVPGLSLMPCKSVGDIQKLMDFGTKKRATSSTNMNVGSSRSHVIFTLQVQRLLGLDPGEGMRDERPATLAKVNFVDLAGSERLGDKELGDRYFREGGLINQSLSALAEVIKVMGEQQASRAVGRPVSSYVPFSSSRLTLLLREAFTGNARTFLIATVSPASICVPETLSTLRFATAAREIELSPIRNVDARRALVPRLQTEIRFLQGRLENELSGNMEEEELTMRENLLREYGTPWEQQVEEADRLDATRDDALRGMGLSSSQQNEVFEVDKDTPYLLNMSTDQILSGVLMYFLHLGATTVGSDAESQILLTGLGVTGSLCTIQNLDQEAIEISLAGGSPETQHVPHGARVRVNGKLLQPEEKRQLKHYDCIVLGRAFAFRLIVPTVQRMIEAGEDNTLPSLVEALYEESMLKLLLPEDSEAWSELRLYFEDLWSRLGEERGREFFGLLGEASHLVDEANDITVEMRPYDRFKFEVELVWDIHREARDIIIIRAMQFFNEEGDASVRSYWTLGKFKERLDMMRDCYDSFHRKGQWHGQGDPLEDPWMDPSSTELGLYMHARAEEELLRLGEREAMLPPKPPVQESVRPTNSYTPSRLSTPSRPNESTLSTPSKSKTTARMSSAPGPLTRAAVAERQKRRSAERSGAVSSRAMSNSARSASSRATERARKPARSSMTPSRGPRRGAVGDDSQERQPSGSLARDRLSTPEPCAERDMSAALQREASPNQRPRSSEIASGGSSLPSATSSLRLKIGPSSSPGSSRLPPGGQVPSSDASTIGFPLDSPGSKEDMINKLRNNLAAREGTEKMYKAKIAALYEQLSQLERLHGPVSSLEPPALRPEPPSRGTSRMAPIANLVPLASPGLQARAAHSTGSSVAPPQLAINVPMVSGSGAGAIVASAPTPGMGSLVLRCSRPAVVLTGRSMEAAMPAPGPQGPQRWQSTARKAPAAAQATEMVAPLGTPLSVPSMSAGRMIPTRISSVASNISSPSLLPTVQRVQTAPSASR